VIKYARTSDYVHGAVAAAGGPTLLYVMERMHPSGVGKGGFPQAMRLAGVLGLGGGFLYFYQRSIRMCLNSTDLDSNTTVTSDTASRHWDGGM
jgi:hypothetical protein